jgi:hypothetical protein
MMTNIVGFCLLAALLAVVGAQQQRNWLDKSSSASDESEQYEYGLQSGVEKAEKCRYMQGDEIRGKVCDFDKLLSQMEKEMIKQALKDLEEKTSTNEYDGIKLSVLFLKNVKDTKETDKKVYEMVKHHANKRQSDRAGFIVLGVESDFSEQQRLYEQKQQTDDHLNNPVFHNAPTGAWSNFYSTANLNEWVTPQEIVQIYSKKASLLRQGTYGVAVLDIIHEIRDKAMQKQGKTQFYMPHSSFESKFEEVQKIEKCLQQFETKVCDPDQLLHVGQKEQVDSVLKELEFSTIESKQQLQTGRWTNCKVGGIKLAAIVIKDVQNHQIFDQKINYMLMQQAQLNPCERLAVLIISPGKDQRTGGQQFQTLNEGGQTIYYYRFPVGGWSKFYGIQNLNMPVLFSEIAEIYDQQKPLIRQGELFQSLKNIIHSFNERVQQHKRFARETDFNAEDNKQKTLNMLDECLNEIKPKICDPSNLLDNEDRDNIQKILGKIQQETERSTEMDESKKKGFVVTFVTIPFTEDVTQHEKKISEKLGQWRQQNPQNHAAVLMLTVNKGDSNGRSKFYGASTRDAFVNPRELVELYDENKLSIRAGKLSEALLKIVNSILDLARRHQTGSEKN